jgi:uncharacterized membrane protein YeaQ/YmgE (transglycosylase-associated protein family)
MNGLYWFLVVAAAGWLTGKMIGDKGYGGILAGYPTDWLDILLGVVGASIAGYLFPGAAIGEGNAFFGYATAIVGSIALVGGARLISTRYMASSVH